MNHSYSCEMTYKIVIIGGPICNLNIPLKQLKHYLVLQTPPLRLFRESQNINIKSIEVIENDVTNS